MATIHGEHPSEIGDGQIYLLCRELQRQIFSPPLETDEPEDGRRKKAGKYA
jgi:hypothetical protein